MSYLFENGSIIGQTLDYRSTTTTLIVDEVNSAANVEVVETKSISVSSTASGADVTGDNSASQSLTLSSTLQEGDIIVVQTFMDVGITDVDDSGSSWVELIGSGGSTNISNINTQLVYKVVASGNETTDKTVSWDVADPSGGAVVVLVRGGTATGLQSNYSAQNAASSNQFPSLSLSGVTSGVALLFSAMDDQPTSSISSFPSGFTTAESFSAGTTGDGCRIYAGYEEGVTSINGPSIEYNTADSIVNVSVLIPIDEVTRTAKTNSGVWDTESVYNDISFVPSAATSATTRTVTPITVTFMGEAYNGEEDAASNTVSKEIGPIVTGDIFIAVVHAESNTEITSPTIDFQGEGFFTEDASIIGGSSNNIHAGIYRYTATDNFNDKFINLQYDNDIENASLQVYKVSDAAIQSTGSADIDLSLSLFSSNAVTGGTGSGLSATLNNITSNNCVAFLSGYIDHSNTSTDSTFSTTSGTLTEIDGVYNASSNLGRGDIGIIANPIHSAVIDYTSDIDNPTGVLAAAVYGVSQESKTAASITPAAGYVQELAVLDDYFNYNVGASASRTIDISGATGFNEVILFTFSARYAGSGTPPVADINSSATNYTAIDTLNSGTFAAVFGGTAVQDVEIAVVTGSTSVTAQIDNSGGSFTIVDRIAAVAFEGLTSSATIHDSAIDYSGASTITDTINVVAGGLLIILAADGIDQTITETTSLLGTITEGTNNQDSDYKLYTAQVNTTGTATIQSVQSNSNSFESLTMYSISP